MTVQSSPSQPSLPWRLTSSALMGFVGSLSRTAMYGANRVEVHGLEQFKALLDERQDPRKRTRGLITVSNHTSVIDDPFIWGTLPFSYSFNPSNHRWTLGSYDICFKNKVTSAIFNFGQVLPTHRIKHSQYGGLFQPTVAEAIRLLSDCPAHALDSPVIQREDKRASLHPGSPDLADPFSSPGMTYSTNGHDVFPAPSGYTSRRYGWIHIFPEGFVHQHPARAMRYFKWGIARLILEADQCPDVVPMWIEGNEAIMPEDRGFPRFVPRLGQRLAVCFGDNVAGARDDTAFADLRRRWQALVRRDRRALSSSSSSSSSWSSFFSASSSSSDDDDDDVRTRPDELSDELKYGSEAVSLRVECTQRVREAVLALRRSRGLPDEDPKASLAATWREEGSARGEGRQDDGSLIKDI